MLPDSETNTRPEENKEEAIAPAITPQGDGQSGPDSDNMLLTGKSNDSAGRKSKNGRDSLQDVELLERGPDSSEGVGAVESTQHVTVFKTYKRRWFGFSLIVLMNIIVSWDWLTFAPVESSAVDYYRVSKTAVNWFSIAFMLGFVVIFPVTIKMLHWGPRPSLMTAAILLFVGNWVRYGGSRSRDGGNYGVVLFGQILIGLSQPFVLAAPTRYSDMWFTDKGRVLATAVTSLANPFGAALGQLINPFWVTKTSDVSSMVLYISIMASIACVPAFFIPKKPPTPVAHSSETPKLRIRESVRVVSKSLEVWLLIIPFWIYVGLFNNISSIINQVMVPYGFSDDDAGIGGAVLIAAGLVASAIMSVILDRTKKFLLAIKCFIPLAGLCYLVFIWMPQTREIPGPYIVLAIMGAANFSLVPVALEFLAELSYPVSPEITATIGWAGGQLAGVIFLLVSDALRAGDDADPPRNMNRALILQGVFALAILPLPLCLGLFGRQHEVRLRRIMSDQRCRE